MREQLAKQQVKLRVEVPSEDILLSADRDMVGQVLINLVKNAIEALHEKADATIKLQAYLDDRSRARHVALHLPHAGARLQRQIMRLHQGNISVNSKLGEGTFFTLSF